MLNYAYIATNIPSHKSNYSENILTFTCFLLFMIPWLHQLKEQKENAHKNVLVEVQKERARFAKTEPHYLQKNFFKIKPL